MKIVLASNSPRRRELLESLAVDFVSHSSSVDEEVSDMIPANAAVSILAQLKALDVATLGLGDLIIGSDTVIERDGVVVGKALVEDDAKATLLSLRGREHHVSTAVAIVDAMSGGVKSAVVSTSVTMRPFSGRELVEYLAGGEWVDKAGSYAIQGRGAALVERVEGCVNNVIGFPLCEVARLLRESGVHVAAPNSIVCRLPSGEPCPRL